MYPFGTRYVALMHALLLGSLAWHVEGAASCADETHVWLVADIEQPSAELSHTQTAWLQALQSCAPMCVKRLSSPLGVATSSSQIVAAAREYIVSNPQVDFVMVTQAYEVYPNPFTIQELLARFKRLLAKSPNGHNNTAPGIVMATQQSCWSDGACTDQQAMQYVEAMAPKHPLVQSFPASQWMGYRAAALHMLSTMLDQGTGSTDLPATPQSDDHLYFNYVVAHPAEVALDIWEEIFGSAARGFFQVGPPPVDAPVPSFRAACSFDGKTKQFCDLSRTWSGCCVGADGFVEMAALNSPSTRPLIWSLELAKWGAELSGQCSQAFRPTTCSSILSDGGNAIAEELRCLSAEVAHSQHYSVLIVVAVLFGALAVGTLFMASRGAMSYKVMEEDPEDGERE